MEVISQAKQITSRLIAGLCASVFLFSVLLSCGSQLVFALAIATAFLVLMTLTVCSVACLSGPSRASPQLHHSNQFGRTTAQHETSFKHHSTSNSRRLCRRSLPLHEVVSGSNAKKAYQPSNVAQFKPIITFFSGMFFWARDRDFSCAESTNSSPGYHAISTTTARCQWQRTDHPVLTAA